jgi:hypothetical protein
MSGKLGSASWAVFLVDGYNVLAAKLQGLTYKSAAATEKVHGLGDLWELNSPTGISTATLTQTGAFFDDTLNGIHDAFKASTDVLRVVCWGIAGNTIGKTFAAMQGAYGMTYDVVGAVGKLTKANVTYIVSGQLDRGAILRDLAAQTANWTGTAVDYTLDTSQRNIPITSATKASPCVVTTTVPHGLTTGQVILTSGNSLAGPSINSEQTVTVVTATTFSVAVNTTGSTGAGTGGSFVLSSTVNGGVGYQAISAYSGFTGVVGKIQHSPDNSSWADLSPSFTNVTTGPIAERIVVAAGTTVNRYTRHVGTVTGAGSITPFAGFCRL